MQDKKITINDVARLAGVSKRTVSRVINRSPSVGEKTYQILRNLGVDKVRVVQEMPLEMMVSVLGVNGRTIWICNNFILLG